MRRIEWMFATVILLFLLSNPARAFKVDLHIWIAQQVLNDAADGRVTINIGDFN